MSIYYFENEAGTYYSENKSRRFIRLKGKAAYEYMKAHHIDQNSLYPTTAKEDNGEPVYLTRNISSNMIGFIIGLFVGGFFGVALMCCLSVASRSDDQMQIPDGKEEYQHHDSSTQ